MPTTRQLRHATVAATSVVAAASWVALTQVAGVRLGVRLPHAQPTTVSLGATAAAGAAAALVGWGALSSLEARTAAARRIWIPAAVVVTLGSLALPIAFATTAAAAAGLGVLHLVVAIVAVTGLTAATRRPSTEPPVLRRRRRGVGRGGHLGLRPSRRAAAAAAAAVLAGTAAGVAVASSADATTSRAATSRAATSRAATSRAATSHASATSSPDAGWWGAIARSPGSWAASDPGRVAAGATWDAPAASGWSAPARSARTEHFHVASTDAAGPGAIIVTGVVDAGGVEHPGRAVDEATFAGGGFRIDHHAGHPIVAFDARTCVGTIDQTGPFSVIDGTGRFSSLAGRGTYVFHALYTTARSASGCTHAMTAYVETINGAVTVSAAAARRLAAAA